MASAANLAVVSTSVDDSSYNVLDGIKNVTCPFQSDELDTTDFADGVFRTFIQGLKVIPIDLDGDYQPSDTAQGQIRTNWTTPGTFYLKVLLDGTNGFKVLCQCFTWEAGGAVDGTATFKASFKSLAAPTFLP